MGLTLGFSLSPASKKRDQDRDLRVADLSDLRYDVFLGDIEFMAGSQDFSARWGWVPLLDFAVGMRVLVRDLARARSGTYQFTESGAELRFMIYGETVEVRANYVDALAKITMAELADASREFAGDVFRAAIRVHPALVENAAFAQLRNELGTETNVRLKTTDVDH